jgi:hypothetical protein
MGAPSHTPDHAMFCSLCSLFPSLLTGLCVALRSVARGNITTSLHSFCELAMTTARTLARRGCPTTTGSKRADKWVPQICLAQRAHSLPASFSLHHPHHPSQIVVLQTPIESGDLRIFGSVVQQPGLFSQSPHAKSRTAAGISTVIVNLFFWCWMFAPRRRLCTAFAPPLRSTCFVALNDS